MASGNSAFMDLIRAIVAADAVRALRLLATAPAFARVCVEEGATRADAKAHFLEEIAHYLYAGDTALHIAAAAYQAEIARKLIALGADVEARNRRGAAPLHYATDGAPGSLRWDPGAQAAAISCLIAAGADPDAADLGGTTPLHRAVRNRCAAAVAALIDGGADARRKNKRGSTAAQLATRNTGRGGTGAPEAKAQQAEIVSLLARHGAAR
jgi:hypothetical protein